MSDKANRMLPGKDSGIMLQASEKWTSPPSMSGIYRIQTITKKGEDHYEVSTWIVEANRMEEFFTDYVNENRKIVDIRPFEKGYPCRKSEETEE